MPRGGGTACGGEWTCPEPPVHVRTTASSRRGSPQVSANATAGFHHVDLNPPEKKTPKMVWEARKPGATLSLCLPMALGVAAQRAERSKTMVEVRGRNMTLPDKQFRSPFPPSPAAGLHATPPVSIGRPFPSALATLAPGLGSA